MVRVSSHVLEVVVLATGSYAFLSVDGPRVRARALSEEDILELIHSCIGEQQCRILVRHDRCAGNFRVRGLVDEELDELASDVTC